MSSRLALLLVALPLWGQVTVSNVQTTATQAVIRYAAPSASTCTLRVADMNRGIEIVSGSQAGGVVTITAKSAHGIASGAVVYIEGSGVSGWDGWQTVTGITSTTFTFSGSSGTSSGGIVGVLVDDMNASLYTGANSDGRSGSITSGLLRTVVIGAHNSPIALDSSRYSRALQTNSRHVYTITCEASTASGDFVTKQPAFGNTWNPGIPVDRSNPGQYAYPTVSANIAQRIIDPVTGLRYQQTGGTTDNTGSTATCSDAVVTVNGVPGYNCFASDLYWISADGSDVRDLGLTMFQNSNDPPNSNWSNSWNAGGWFDPLDGDTWYSVINYAWDNSGRITVIKVHYTGSHAAGTPGQTITDCALNNNVQPCLQFTVMQPNKSDSVTVSGPGFNPAYAASGYQIGNLEYVGVGATGDMVFYTRELTQDTKGWIFVYTLGDRTPAGTGPNSIRPIASMSSYQTAPCSWCVIHSMVQPNDNGWLRVTTKGGLTTGGLGYTMTLEAALSATPTTCPPNSLGVTGANCSTISVSGEPLSGGVSLQPTQVGDVFWADNEPMRIVSKLSSTSLVVQRGYVYNPYEGIHAVAAHLVNATLSMDCGSLNQFNGATTLWDYRDDPYGTNSTGNTILMDPNEGQAHEWNTPTVTINSGGAWYNTGDASCPTGILGNSGTCYIVRLGHLSTIVTAPMIFVAMAPPFAGVNANGTPNQVDSHPGFCSQTQPWCFDSRPMDGGSYLMVGSSGSPFVNVTGQLWKFAGAQSVLNRKSLNTVAYVGSSPLVDVSGPASSIGSTSATQYEYCYAQAGGECYSGSSIGDLYVNAPSVANAYCPYPGIAVQPSANSICIGDLASPTMNLMQVGVGAQDFFGVNTRRLGSGLTSWQQGSVFWTLNGATNGLLGFSQILCPNETCGTPSNYIATVPPFGLSDSQNRGSFQSIDVSVPAISGASTALVEFGYSENGGQFYCTSRQEACAAVSAAVDQATPFYWESETFSRTSCAAGCTIALPALPEHVVYYRYRAYETGGALVATGPTLALAVN